MLLFVDETVGKGLEEREQLKTKLPYKLLLSFPLVLYYTVPTHSEFLCLCSTKELGPNRVRTVFLLVDSVWVFIQSLYSHFTTKITISLTTQSNLLLVESVESELSTCVSI